MKKFEFDATKYDVVVNDNTITITPKMQTLKEWVEETLSNADKDVHFLICTAERSIIAINTRTVKAAKAVCAEDDEFDLNLGKAIAYAKLTGIPVHKEAYTDASKYKEALKRKLTKICYNCRDCHGCPILTAAKKHGKSCRLFVDFSTMENPGVYSIEYLKEVEAEVDKYTR